MNPYLNSILEQEIDVVDVSLDGETLAYTWFGRTNAVASDSAQKYWIGTTKDTPSGTTQHVTEFNNVTKKYTTTQVGTVFQKDDHNQAQLLIRQSDNKLIAFYVEHNGSQLRWRISTNPLDSTSWGAEETANPVQAYSYISPYQASNGDIYVFWRSHLGGGTFQWYYMKSTDGGENFGSAVTVYANGSVQAYFITCQYGDKIHIVATNGHPSNNSNININLYHCYFDMNTETFHKSDGSSVSTPFAANDLTLVKATYSNDTSWNLDITTKNGKPRILYAFYPEGRANNFIDKELGFIEWDGSSWVNDQIIAQTMSGYIEDDGSTQEKAYTGASRFDTANPDIIWMPKELNGILEIHKVDLRTNPIYIEQLTFNSEVDNWRPISVPSPLNNLLWIKKNRYDMYTNYELTLQTKTVHV